MPTDLVAVMDYTSIKELTMNSMNVMNAKPFLWWNSTAIAVSVKLWDYINIVRVIWLLSTKVFAVIVLAHLMLYQHTGWGKRLMIINESKFKALLFVSLPQANTLSLSYDNYTTIPAPTILHKYYWKRWSKHSQSENSRTYGGLWGLVVVCMVVSDRALAAQARCPGFDSRWLLDFSLSSVSPHNIYISLFIDCS